MRLSTATGLFVSMFAIACSVAPGDERSPSPPGGPQPGPEVPEPAERLASAPCRFNVPASAEGTAFKCYDLLVPENRGKRASRPIKVHVIVFKGKDGGTPTIELNGGPGGPSEDLAVGLAVGFDALSPEYGRFLEQGDLVLVDQRGTGRSQPRITCTDRELDRGPIAGGQACADRFAKEGVDLAGYVTAENAEDIHDLVVALGNKPVNLHSISYGTRLALEVLRRHPSDVRAAIIDGVLPAQGKALSEGDLNIDDVVSRIFAACLADTKCNATYPDLEKALSDLKTKLDMQPFTYQGFPYDFYAFAGELFQDLYGEGMAATVPMRIHRLLNGTQAQFEADMKALDDDWAKMDAERDEAFNKTPLGREALKRMKADPDPGAGQMAEGMYLSVVCSDYAPYESLDEALANEARIRPVFRNEAFVREIFEACKPWPARAKTENVFAAVTSDRPVLGVGGLLDPATPARWRDLARQTLGKSQAITMKAGAHGAMDACGMQAKMAFLAAPEAKIDAACGEAQTIAFTYVTGPSPFHHTAKVRASQRLTQAQAPLAPLTIHLARILGERRRAR
jgi:pimeloyl-ACP methyl ester carboxylesterase